MSELIHVIYNSAATTEFSADDLRRLLNKSRNKNAASEVTGMLLYIHGTFFQILEGPEPAIDTLVARIQQDDRHDRMTVIVREPIARRAFGEWTMGFAQLEAEDVEHIDGLNDFFTGGHVLDDLDAGRAKKLLTAFQQGRWRVSGGRRRTAAAVRAEQIDPRPPFTFAFQPIVDAAERRVVGYEALIRGNDQETAAEVLQSVSLDEVSTFEEDARRRAVALAHRLGLKGRLHLNVLPQLWRDGATSIESTLETARLCDVDPSRLVLEIKHESYIPDAGELGAQLADLRSAGVHVSIDNFGSGYAGLALLDRFQPDMISLDMWLVRNVDAHGPRQAILRGLAQTCGDLGIDFVAKGVETIDEYEWLRSEGIELFQGFLFARPGIEALPRPMIPADAS